VLGLVAVGLIAGNLVGNSGTELQIAAAPPPASVQSSSTLQVTPIAPSPIERTPIKAAHTAPPAAELVAPLVEPTLPAPAKLRTPPKKRAVKRAIARTAPTGSMIVHAPPAASASTDDDLDDILPRSK
jgi:hypothetical protein